MRLTTMSPWMALAALSACSSDGGGRPNGGTQTGDDDCALTVELSGAVQQSVGFGQNEGCGGGADETARSLAMGWGGITNPLNFHVTIQPIDEGVLGSFPATVRVKDGDRIWRTTEGACEVEVTRFELTDTDNWRHYALAGTGTCASEALAAEGGATGNVNVGGFEFRGIAIY